MGLFTAIALVTWGRRRERRRQRRLDEQAERQRLRAPEPEPEPEVVQTHRELLDRSDREIFWLAMIPVVPLAILAVFVNPWIFWVGLFVLCAAIGAVVAMVSD
jgi:hypothetical protein